MECKCGGATVSWGYTRARVARRRCKSCGVTFNVEGRKPGRPKGSARVPLAACVAAGPKVLSVRVGGVEIKGEKK